MHEQDLKESSPIIFDPEERSFGIPPANRPPRFPADPVIEDTPLLLPTPSPPEPLRLMEGLEGVLLLDPPTSGAERSLVSVFLSLVPF